MSFKAFAHLICDELMEVIDKTDESQIEPILDAIMQARKVFVYGLGREGTAMEFFVMRLMHLGKTAVWAWDDTAPACGPDDLFIISNGSGKSTVLNSVAQRVRDAGCKLLTITANRESPLSEKSDIVFFLPAFAYRVDDPSELVATKQSMGSLYEIASVVVCDSIIASLQAKMSVCEEQMKQRHRNFH